VFDNPELVVACVSVTGEAETGPSCYRMAFPTNSQIRSPMEPLLPILHLNGYKIANPLCWPASSIEELDHCSAAYGWKPYFVEGE